ncbi:SMI1/KNR4 family protein [Aestuariibius sp. 2305UL40-4]|uniref:SMI1/KNR4 family protein n=1 Tax=Aestuariibius violaceus TaxID=3234132 RepID=UPI00345E2518
MELKLFAEKWGDQDRIPKPVEASELQEVEQTFGIVLPIDYVEQVTAIGLPWPPHLLSAIADEQVELHDLSELCTPNEIVSETEGWHPIGLPENLLVIGNDSMGSKFCFDMKELEGDRKSVAAIFFWDHDFNDTAKVANSFSEWIAQYLGPWSDEWFATS